MRKMATIEQIRDILPIEGSNSVCKYIIKGWCVVDRIGLYNIGDYVVYCEIDSWIPHELAPFLTPEGKEPKTYLGVKGQLLKTKKIRGVLSQGLILNITLENIIEIYKKYGFIESYKKPLLSNFILSGTDVSEYLRIVKYDPPESSSTNDMKGNFPKEVRKTDQERVQNIDLNQYEGVYQVTEKLEGCSCTFYLSEKGDFEVCSRNISLKEDENNKYWQAAFKYHIKELMIENEMYGLAIQGELVGESIQGNIYNFKGIDFYVFDIFDTKKQQYLETNETIDYTLKLKIEHVPIIYSKYYVSGEDKDALLDLANFTSNLNYSIIAEGLVFKSLDRLKSFKVISNQYII